MALTMQPNCLWSEEIKPHFLEHRLNKVFIATCKSSRGTKNASNFQSRQCLTPLTKVPLIPAFSVGAVLTLLFL